MVLELCWSIKALIKWWSQVQVQFIYLLVVITISDLLEDLGSYPPPINLIIGITKSVICLLPL